MIKTNSIYTLNKKDPKYPRLQYFLRCRLSGKDSKKYEKVGRKRTVPSGIPIQ